MRHVIRDLIVKLLLVVEQNLYLINDFPGVNADGYFEPGSQIGDTKLNINIKNESRYNLNFRLDNHGTDQTGLYRLYADFQLNNTLGFADIFKLSVLDASSPNNTKYWRLNYQMNAFSPRLKLGIGASKNQFVVDQISTLSLDGVVRVNDLSAVYVFRRSRVENYNAGLKYEKIESDLKQQREGVAISGINNDESLKNSSIQFNYDILQESAQVLHQGNFRWTSGEYVYTPIAEPGDRYNVLSADYTSLMFLKVPYFEANSRLIFRASAQRSGDVVSSILRFSLAGPTRVRAYSPNFYSADDAVYLGADWVFNSPDFMDIDLFADINLQESVRPFIFADYGYGKQLSIEGAASGSDVSGKLADIGFGFQLVHGASFKGSLQFAFPLKTDFSNPEVVPEEEGMRVLFDMQYGF